LGARAYHNMQIRFDASHPLGSCSWHLHQLEACRTVGLASRSAQESAVQAVNRHRQRANAASPNEEIMLNQLLTTMYSANALLVALVYVPQIRAIWNDPAGARAISLLTWSVWSSSSCVTFLYGWLVLRDGPMMIAAAASASGSVGVLGVSAYRRHCARRAPLANA
jgi:hypothetical protein